MAAIIFTDGNFQGIDDNGEVVANGTLVFNNFHDGTPAHTFKDSEATISNPYIIPLSPSGKADVYLTGGDYEIVLKDSDGVIVRTVPRFIPFLGSNGGVNYPFREEFTSVNDQTEFTLSEIPIGTGSLHIDGKLLSLTEYSVGGNLLTVNDPLGVGQIVIFEYSNTSEAGGGGGVSDKIVVTERNSVLDTNIILGTVATSSSIIVTGGKRITQAFGFNDNGQVDSIEVLQGDTVDVSLLGVLEGKNYFYKKLNGVYAVTQVYDLGLDLTTMVGVNVYLGEFTYAGGAVSDVIAARPALPSRAIESETINGRVSEMVVTGILDGTTLYLSSTRTTAHVIPP